MNPQDEALSVTEEPDMSWFDIAVTHRKEVVILGNSPGWEDFAIEHWWEDTFINDAPGHLTPGAYRWTGFKVGFWSEGDHLNVTGGEFIPLRLSHSTPGDAEGEIPGRRTWQEAYNSVLASHRNGTIEGWELDLLRRRVEAAIGGDAEVRKALKNARDALLAVGNDYPGSSCQQWCTQKAREAWSALEPWRHCPSTHCERAQECRSVNECSAERSTLATPSQEEVLHAYDAGLLSDFGGGDVDWWQDYIRSELESAHQFYASQFLATPSGRAQGEVGQ